MRMTLYTVIYKNILKRQPPNYSVIVIFCKAYTLTHLKICPCQTVSAASSKPVNAIVFSKLMFN